MYYEHIVATKVFMPMVVGGGVSGKVHYEHILATKVLMPMWEGGWVSGKVHYSGNVPGNEHSLATKKAVYYPPPPPGMNTSWLINARYAIDIRIGFLLNITDINISTILVAVPELHGGDTSAVYFTFLYR